MKKAIGPLLLVFLLGCKSEEEKTVAQISKTIETAINDEAFKANEKVQLLEVRYIDRHEITQREIDSVHLINLALERENLKQVADLEIKYANLLINEASAKSKMALLNGQKLNPEVMTRAKAEIKMHTDRAKELLDTVRYLFQEDSVIHGQMVDPKTAENKFYLVRYVQKSTISNHNQLDTFSSILDKQWKLIPPRVFGSE